MKLKYDWWLFKKQISIENCNKIIKLSSVKKKAAAITGKFGKERNTKIVPLTEKEKQQLKKERDSSVVFLSDPLVYDMIIPLINTANKKAGWNFDVHLTEESQFTEYKKNNFYDWHQDCWDEPYSTNDNRHNTIRKLSSILLLENSTKYEGGELQFHFNVHPPGTKPTIITLKEFCNKGDFIVFPSHITHRVMPVTKGKRYSLVNWHLGYPFK